MKVILAAVDLSDATSRVMQVAENLARAIDGRIVLLHVTRTPSALPPSATQTAHLAEVESAIESAADRQLERWKQGLAERGVPAQTLRLAGEPSRDILEQAEELAVDFIVMGSHGHSALHDLVMGSTTRAVLQRTHRVVIFVPVGVKSAARVALRRRTRKSGTRRNSERRGEAGKSR